MNKSRNRLPGKSTKILASSVIEIDVLVSPSRRPGERSTDEIKTLIAERINDYLNDKSYSAKKVRIQILLGNCLQPIRTTQVDDVKLAI